MLRFNDCPPGKAGKTAAWVASVGLMVIASATGLARGAAVADEPPAKEQPVAETARLEKPQAPLRHPPAAAERLFARDPFDPAVMRVAKSGGFVIRVGEILRHPKVASDFPHLKQLIAAGLSMVSGIPMEALDVSQIDWIAGNLHAIAKPSKPDSKFAFAVGAQAVVIRMNRAADWQKLVLENVPGASLQNHDGRTYVQLPEMPLIGPGHPVVRFRDERTIVAIFGFKQDSDEAKQKIVKHLLDDSPGQHDWADTWQTVDGGLATFVFDNREVGWRDLPQDAEISAAARSLLAKTDFFAVALDWNPNTDHSTLRVRSACADFAAAQAVYQATLAWRTEFTKEVTEQEPGSADDSPEMKTLASARSRLGDENAEQPFVETTLDLFLPFAITPAKPAD